MAERRGGSDVTIVSPLYETGVHNAGVHTRTAPHGPDPMGYLDPHGTEAPTYSAGGGDESNDWPSQTAWPEQTNVQGQKG